MTTEVLHTEHAIYHTWLKKKQNVIILIIQLCPNEAHLTVEHFTNRLFGLNIYISACALYILMEWRKWGLKFLKADELTSPQNNSLLMLVIEHMSWR